MGDLSRPPRPWPVYARGLCPNGCNKDGGGEVGAIIACGGVAVRPGDIIVVDRDGVAVVPLDDAAEVAQLTVAKVGSERQVDLGAARCLALVQIPVDKSLALYRGFNPRVRP